MLANGHVRSARFELPYETPIPCLCFCLSPSLSRSHWGPAPLFLTLLYFGTLAAFRSLSLPDSLGLFSYGSKLHTCKRYHTHIHEQYLPGSVVFWHTDIFSLDQAYAHIFPLSLLLSVHVDPAGFNSPTHTHTHTDTHTHANTKRPGLSACFVCMCVCASAHRQFSFSPTSPHLGGCFVHANVGLVVHEGDKSPPEVSVHSGKQRLFLRQHLLAASVSTGKRGGGGGGEVSGFTRLTASSLQRRV